MMFHRGALRRIHSLLEATVEEKPHFLTGLDMVGKIRERLRAPLACLAGHQWEEAKEEKEKEK